MCHNDWDYTELRNQKNYAIYNESFHNSKKKDCKGIHQENQEFIFEPIFIATRHNMNPLNLIICVITSPNIRLIPQLKN